MSSFRRPLLDVGEHFCPDCRGYGVPNTYEGDRQYLDQCYVISMTRCRKCDGEGKLDWIEQVVGKRMVK